MADASGNVYATGTFYGSTDFDPGSGTHALTAQANPGGASYDIFAVTRRSSGNFFVGHVLGGRDGAALGDRVTRTVRWWWSAGSTARGVQPTAGQYMLTSSANGSMFVWDLTRVLTSNYDGLWADLGTVTVTNGTVTVELSDAANGQVIADAVRLWLETPA